MAKNNCDSSPHRTKKRDANISANYYDRDYYIYQSQKILSDICKEELDFALDGIASIKNKNILEIGCGSGKNLELFNRSNRLCGIDYSRDAVKICHEKGFYNTIHASADAVPIKSGWVEILLIIDVVEHLEPFRFKKLIVEVNRLLSSNGIVVVITPISDRIPLFIRKLFNYVMGLEPTYYWRGHINELTLDECLNSFGSIGLKPFKIKISSDSHFPRLSKALNYILGGI